MLTVLGITFPIFALVLIGYLLVLRGVFKPADMRIFGIYVTNVALPALLFKAASARPVGEIFNLPYMAAYMIGGLLTTTAAVLWFYARTDREKRGIAIMGTTCPNSGFVGYPLLLILLPDLAGLVLAMNMLVENVILIPLLLALMEMMRAGQHHPLVRVRKGVFGVFKRPFVIGLLLGLLASLLDVQMPAPMMRVFDILAASAAAISLIVIGGSLAGLSTKGKRALAFQITLAKLLLHPALTLLGLVALTALGAGVTGDLRTALILSAAMPIFGTYIVFAQEEGQEGVASIALLMSTVGAFLTLNIALLMLS
ncbi:MAG: AEC family transporter [Maritimibacter sp.]